jgi:hypothetical protein
VKKITNGSSRLTYLNETTPVDASASIGASATADMWSPHRFPPNVEGQTVPNAATRDNSKKLKAEMAFTACILNVLQLE